MSADNARRDDFFKNFGIPLPIAPRPRAPPSFIRPPTPLHLERPRPIVPDVSLIIDSASTSIHSNLEFDDEEADPALALKAADRNEKTSSIRDASAVPRIPRSSYQNSTDSGVGPNLNYANFYPTPPMGMGFDSSSGQFPGYDRREDESFTRQDVPIPTQPNASGELSGTTDTLVPSLPDASERNYDSTLQTEEINVLKADIAQILQVVNEQSSTISHLDAQLKQIISFQEKFLFHFVNKGKRCSKTTQTGMLCVKETETNPQRKISNTSASTNGQLLKNSKASDNNGSTCPSPAANQRPLRNFPQSSTGNSNPPHTMAGVETKEESSLTGTTNKQMHEVSNILRHLQINNSMSGPSMYAVEPSLKSIDFPPINDDSFHKDNNSFLGSACPGQDLSGSSSEDEDISSTKTDKTVVPSTCVYNDVLSTVNRLLDKGKETGSGTTSVSNHVITPSRNNVADSSGNGRQHLQHPVSDFGESISSSTSIMGSLSSSGSSSVGSVNYQRNLPNLGNSFDKDENKENRAHGNSNNVVDVTKNYLRSLGVQFDSLTPPTSGTGQQEYKPLQQQQQPSTLTQTHQSQNYMIQQNVFNSIYIPTVNCVPVVSGSLNSNSGVMENLAHKYISPPELNQYDLLQNKHAGPGAVTTETTVYGMSPSNLSFATKQYLQRYGLVGQGKDIQSSKGPGACEPYLVQKNTDPRFSLPFTAPAIGSSNDRILDVTAIRNQPKLL